MKPPSSSIDWFVRDIGNHIELDAPGIYQWCIGAGVYIGKSKRLHRRLREYPNNVRKLVEKRAYRKSDPGGFRRVHRELYAAREAKAAITFSVLENCELADLDERERLWIRTRREEEAAGGPSVLNSN